MERFTRLFGHLLVFVYHCLDRIVIHGHLSGLSRPEQVVHFFRQVVGVRALDKSVLSPRTSDYQNWVEAFARNHRLPIEWAEKGVRKEDYVLLLLRLRERFHELTAKQEMQDQPEPDLHRQRIGLERAFRLRDRWFRVAEHRENRSVPHSNQW